MIETVRKNNRGSLLIELVIAAGIAVFVFSSFFATQNAFFGVKRNGLIRMQAAYYAAEAMEAVRRVRDDKTRGFYGVGIQSLAVSDDGSVGRFIPQIINGDWSIVPYLSSVQHDALYNPKDGYQVGIYFYMVNRNTDEIPCKAVPIDTQLCGAILPGSGSDTNTRKVVTRVCWGSAMCQNTTPGGDTEVVMETYLTGWKN